MSRQQGYQQLSVEKYKRKIVKFWIKDTVNYIDYACDGKEEHTVSHGGIFALCNDGTLLFKRFMTDGWAKIPEIPQD